MGPTQNLKFPQKRIGPWTSRSSLSPCPAFTAFSAHRSAEEGRNDRSTQPSESEFQRCEAMFLHDFRRWLTVERKRPNVWRRASKDWKRDHPTCAICTGKKDLEAHDVLPYHLIPDAGSKTRDFWYGNFITLCCHDHRSLGHCADPKCDTCNPKITEMANAVENLRGHCTS